MSEELLGLSALAQADLVRGRRVGAEELTRLYLGRIERENPRLNAFVTVLGASALREARARDAALARGRGDDGALFLGVPVGVKDLDLVRGAPAKMGSAAYAWFWSPVDGPTAAALRRAGFVITGKLATSELGALPVTEPDIHPPTRNPFCTDRSAGGSSGGSGAAIAARLLPIAPGSDGAGSIRIPAAFCHVYGLKPSRGRLWGANARIDPHAITTVGPLARSVEDAAALLDALGGAGTVTAARAPGSFLDLCRRPIDRLRVRFATKSPLGGTVDPPIAEAVRRVAETLAARGHHVEEGAVVEGSLDEFLPIWQRQLAQVPLFGEARLQPVTRWLRVEGRKHTPEKIAALQGALSARILGAFGNADLWVLPTVPQPAPMVGAFRNLGPEETFRAVAQYGAFTAMFNLTGQPAASLPMGLGTAGAPIGVQLAGRPGADAAVLAVSREIEEALPWASVRPPL
jgi:amidase